MSGARNSETRLQRLRRIAAAVLGPRERTAYFDGMFAVSATIVKVDRKTYPTVVHLRIKTGADENRVSTNVDMTWAEVERLHEAFGYYLADRAALEKKLAPYRAAGVR